MFETILYFFSTDVCEISGQRTGSRRRGEVGRLFDWTITPRQKSSPSVNPFHSCLFFSFPSLPLSHPPSFFLVVVERTNGKIRTNNFTKFSRVFFFSTLIWNFVERRKVERFILSKEEVKSFSFFFFFLFRIDSEFHLYSCEGLFAESELFRWVRSRVRCSKALNRQMCHCVVLLYLTKKKKDAVFLISFPILNKF